VQSWTMPTTDVHEPRPAAVAVVRRITKRRRWGAVQARVTRPDHTSLELTLFSPDTTDVERAWLQLWRSWRLAGLVPTAATFVLIGAAGGFLIGGIAALILYGVGFGVFAQNTPDRGRRMVVLRGGFDRREGFDQPVGDVTRITAWAARLDAADIAFDAGEITAEQRDAVWREAWETITA
jgi:hypothetical protein